MRATSRGRPSAGCRPTASRPGSSACRTSAAAGAPSPSRSCRSAPRGMSPPRRTLSSEASTMLRSIEKSITSPCWRRSSGTRRDAGRHRRASAIPAAGTFRRSRPTRRPSDRSRRSRERPPSVPAPTRPARATISPLRTSNETSVNTPSRVSRSTFRTTRPGSAGTFGNRASMSRPTIARITDSIVSSSMGFVRTWRPSRITVTR